MMNTLFKISLSGVLLIFSLIAKGQSEDKPVLVTIETLEKDYHESKAPKKISKKLPSKQANKDLYRHHKKLPKTFEGYVIELTTSDFPLNRDYHLFEQFGTVYYDHIKNRGYSYVILADFSSKKSIEQYIQNVIIHKAPEAKMITYKKGKRLIPN